MTCIKPILKLSRHVSVFETRITMKADSIRRRMQDIGVGFNLDSTLYHTNQTKINKEELEVEKIQKLSII